MKLNDDGLPDFGEDDFETPDGQLSNQYSDESGDKKYFVQIPEIVTAKTDPYEYRLWAVIKMITGESGKCTAGAKLLARLAGMSVGKVSQCRKSLHEKGLLRTKREEISAHTSRIIIVIPDLWEQNVTWRKKAGDSLYGRAKIYEQNRKKAVKTKKSKR